MTHNPTTRHDHSDVRTDHDGHTDDAPITTSIRIDDDERRKLLAIAKAVSDGWPRVTLAPRDRASMTAYLVEVDREPHSYFEARSDMFIAGVFRGACRRDDEQRARDKARADAAARQADKPRADAAAVEAKRLDEERKRIADERAKLRAERRQARHRSEVSSYNMALDRGDHEAARQIADRSTRIDAAEDRADGIPPAPRPRPVVTHVGGDVFVVRDKERK